MKSSLVSKFIGKIRMDQLSISFIYSYNSSTIKPIIMALAGILKSMTLYREASELKQFI